MDEALLDFAVALLLTMIFWFVVAGAFAVLTLLAVAVVVWLLPGIVWGIIEGMREE